MGSLSLQLQSSISFLCLGEYLYIRVGSAKIRSSKGKFSGAFFEFVKKFKKNTFHPEHIFFHNFSVEFNIILFFCRNDYEFH